MSSLERRALQRSAFPNGVPRLWCPILTHFQAARKPDSDRISQHLNELSPFVKGLLVPGSTGEGWEMDDEDVVRLLDIVLPVAEALGQKVLLGILKKETSQVILALDRFEDFYKHPAFVGVTVCPPAGAERTQSDIADALRQVLTKGVPTALYQLPQVTQNEMNPETVASLASEFPNFIMFKDTSGRDQVALSGLDFGGVNFVRGSEQGGYAKWTRAAGGPYDGYLLSTANVLAPELSKIQYWIDNGDSKKAEEMSVEIEGLVSSVFEIVQTASEGNAFTNANKVMYHLRSYGLSALKIATPMLYGGERLPVEFIRLAFELTSSKYPWLLTSK